jgi:hypothetical protein
MSEIDYVCSECGGFDFLYARPRWCPFCVVRVDSAISDIREPEAPRKHGVKRIRIDHGQDEIERVKRQIEFNETKRILDKKINIGGDGLSACEYDALIKSWVNIQ